MEYFLQQVPSKQDPSQSFYDHQNILQELKVRQQENIKLLRNVQELEGKNAYLMSASKYQNKQNSQPVNMRIGKLESKFNQLAELTESSLQRYNNKLSHGCGTDSITKKINIVKNKKQCWYCRKYGHILSQFRKFQQKQELESFKLWKSISNLYCTHEGLIYRKKLHIGSEILMDLAFAQQRRDRQMLGMQLD